jgi:hypothetical protein
MNGTAASKATVRRGNYMLLLNTTNNIFLEATQIQFPRPPPGFYRIIAPKEYKQKGTRESLKFI